MEKNKPKIDYNLCIQCGTCVAVCPSKAIKFKHDKPEIDYNLCHNCGQCVENCPVGAIKEYVGIKRENSV